VDSDLLIALNTVEDLDRAVRCRLGLENDWLARKGRGSLSAGFSRVQRATLDQVRLQLGRAAELAEIERGRAAAAGARIVTRIDRGYPEALLDLALPPPVLYCRGELPRAPAVSIVGSRQADAYGLEAAESFAAYLSALGLTIVSGLALGIDSAAHRGALRPPSGRTVAVLGCGIDVEYPRGSARLAERISRAGALVSEFPIGARPYRAHFPLRNRIIAALGLGTFVVRATARSGSLITARLALELGRDVYALPGNIYDRRSIGPNTLIRDGALPAQHPREIVESLPSWVQAQLEPFDEPASVEEPPPERRLRGVWKSVPRSEAVTAEAISEASGKEVQEVLAQLMELELGGWVRRYPGPCYCRRG
jgi:DNA processing protein